MISFLECSMAIQNVLMILLEICMILELILLLVRITCFSGKKKIVTAVAAFVVSARKAPSSLPAVAAAVEAFDGLGQHHIARQDRHQPREVAQRQGPEIRCCISPLQ